MAKVRGLVNMRRVGIADYKAFDLIEGQEYTVPDYVADHLAGTDPPAVAILGRDTPPPPSPTDLKIADLEAQIAERDRLLEEATRPPAAAAKKGNQDAGTDG